MANRKWQIGKTEGRASRSLKGVARTAGFAVRGFSCEFAVFWPDHRSAIDEELPAAAEEVGGN
jgi:hypothetical protein